MDEGIVPINSSHTSWCVLREKCLLCFSVAPIVPVSVFINSHRLPRVFIFVCGFDRRMFLMLCSCHVDILGGLACISHLCRSEDFVCLHYYGRPQLLFRTLEEPLNASSRVVCSAAAKEPGEAALESMKLWTRSLRLFL